jgi:hypothetical protein
MAIQIYVAGQRERRAGGYNFLLFPALFSPHSTEPALSLTLKLVVSAMYVRARWFCIFYIAVGQMNMDGWGYKKS